MTWLSPLLLGQLQQTFGIRTIEARIWMDWVDFFFWHTGDLATLFLLWSHPAGWVKQCILEAHVCICWVLTEPHKCNKMQNEEILKPKGQLENLRVINRGYNGCWKDASCDQCTKQLMWGLQTTRFRIITSCIFFYHAWPWMLIIYLGKELAWFCACICEVSENRLIKVEGQ